MTDHEMSAASVRAFDRIDSVLGSLPLSAAEKRYAIKQGSTLLEGMVLGFLRSGEWIGGSFNPLVVAAAFAYGLAGADEWLKVVQTSVDRHEESGSAQGRAGRGS